MPDPLDYASETSSPSPKSALGLIGALLSVLAFASLMWAMMFHWNRLTACIAPVMWLAGFSCGVVAVRRQPETFLAYAAILLNALGMVRTIVQLLHYA